MDRGRGGSFRTPPRAATSPAEAAAGSGCGLPQGEVESVSTLEIAQRQCLFSISCAFEIRHELCSTSPKVAVGCGAEKKISKDCAKQTVNSQLRQRVEGAEDHVVGDPGEGKPARPVVAAEHTHSTHNRYETE